MQRITLLPPPSLNRIHTIAEIEGHHRIVYTKDAREWKKGQANMLLFLHPVPKPREVRVDILWFLAKGDKGDLDNRLKLLLDALQGFGYENDSQIACLHIDRVREQRWSKMEITIEDIADRSRDRSKPEVLDHNTKPTEDEHDGDSGDEDAAD